MHGLHRWLAVFVRCAEENVAVPGDTFDVKDLAGDEAFKDIMRLEIAELVEDRPEVVWRLDFADADGRGVGARLQQPWSGYVAEEAVKVVVVEDAAELGNGNTFLFCSDAHGKFVAEVSVERFAHSGQTHVLTQECGNLE